MRETQRSEERATYKATCAECGKEADVPFEPTEGRPVYCGDCFKKHRKPTTRRPFKRFESRRPRETHKTKCAECGKETEVPFKPTEGRPVYCRECYSNKRQ